MSLVSFSYTTVFCKQVNTGYSLISFCLGNSLLPLGNGLPDHMQTDGQIFLGQALGLPVGFEIFLEHRQKPPCISSLSIVNLPRCGKQRKETKGETG